MSNYTPPGPLSEHDLIQQWNNQADKFNQWDSLDTCEQLAWAQIRAIAADRSRPAAPPAPGEVAELVAVLQVEARSEDICGNTTVITAAELRRAATLLQQQAAPAPAVVPVAVTERPWEREEWCDRLGRCWMGDPGGQGFIASWRLCRPEDAPSMTVSLPHHAIPLPQGGEGEG